MKKVKSIFLAIAVVISIAGCKKGDTGPQGLAGTNGKDGNANVHVLIHTVMDTAWSDYNSGTVPGIKAYFGDIYLTQSIADSGLVMVYEGSGSSWKALPFASSSTLSYSEEWSFSSAVNRVEIYYTRSDGSLPNSWGVFGFFLTKTYKVVTVSSSVLSAHPNTDWKNLEEVQSVLHL